MRSRAGPALLATSPAAALYARYGRPWYGCDLFDNLGRPSARAIIPELQHLAPGDIVPMMNLRDRAEGRGVQPRAEHAHSDLG